MKRIFLLLLFSNTVHAQTAEKENRFDFAQTTIGLNLYYSGNGSTQFVDENGELQSYNLGHQIYPALHFGGLHFWNSTELYFALPLGSLFRKNLKNNTQVSLNTSDIFGIKYYPWKIYNQTFRPFVGASIGAINYQQKSYVKYLNGALVSKIVFPFSTGMSWRKNRHLVDFTIKFNPESKLNYYISKNQNTSVNTPSLYLGVSYIILLEGTKGNQSFHYSGKERKKYLELKEKNLLNSFYVAIGPSLAFFTKKNHYNTSVRPYLHSTLTSNVFLDFNLGYYYEPLNGFVDIAFRNIKTQTDAFGTEQSTIRKSILIEANKYLLDYQGFVPYLGLGLGFEQLNFTENEAQQTVEIDRKKVRPTITFGWDVLPTKLEYMTLRTNLRYTPDLSVEHKGYKIPMAQLEFNIIQLVFYPQRFYNFKKYDN